MSDRLRKKTIKTPAIDVGYDKMAMLKMRKLILWGACTAMLAWSASGETMSPRRGGGRPLATGESPPGAPVLVRLHADKTLHQAGESVWVDFSITNVTTSPVTLRAPERPERDAARRRLDAVDHERLDGVGLPLGHIFSGVKQSALTITTEDGASYDAHTYLFRSSQVPDVQLAPHGSVGMRLDLTRYYELLKRPGTYTLVWRPYNGDFASKPITITLMAEQQAIINTNLGRMTMRFYYDEAPRHVANFIELARKNFYRDLTFHRVIPGGLVQGGDPRGDGRGIRPDGKRLKAEFNQILFEYGTVGMARSPRDPDSASCQFFICLSRQPTFDGKQTAFAYLVGDESFETLNKIAAVPTGPDDRPVSRVFIKSITVENVPARSSSGSLSAQREGGPITRPDRVGAFPAEDTRERDGSAERGGDEPGSTQPAAEEAVTGTFSSGQGS